MVEILSFPDGQMRSLPVQTHFRADWGPGLFQTTPPEIRLSETDDPAMMGTGVTIWPWSGVGIISLMPLLMRQWSPLRIGGERFRPEGEFRFYLAQGKEHSFEIR
jgi:hypothetical protein